MSRIRNPSPEVDTFRVGIWNLGFGTRDFRWAPPRPGAPAAHLRVCLALLPSGPDAVRRLKLHRVRAAVRPTNRRRERGTMSSAPPKAISLAPSGPFGVTPYGARADARRVRRARRRAAARRSRHVRRRCAPRESSRVRAAAASPIASAAERRSCTGNTAVSNPGTVCIRTAGISSTVLDRDEPLDHLQRLAHRRAVADDAEQQLGRGVRRHDVRRDAAFDQPDGVVRPSEQRDPRGSATPRSTISASSSLSMADSPSSGNDECAARPRARAAARAARRAWPTPRRLSVGSPLIRNLHAVRRVLVGDARAVAAALLADDEQQRRTRDSPAARSRSAAAPAPQECPWRRTSRGRRSSPRSSRLGKNGGTQSKCVEKTTCGGASSCAKTLKRPSATGCSMTR